MGKHDEYEDDKLVKLGDIKETVKLGDKDIREYSVKDRHGHDIGKVEDLMIDQRKNTVRFLLVESGGFLGIGVNKTLIPVDAIVSIAKYEVHIDLTREAVAGAPAYDPELVGTRTYHKEHYDYYSYTPYWMGGSKDSGIPFQF